MCHSILIYDQLILQAKEFLGTQQRREQLCSKLHHLPHLPHFHPSPPHTLPHILIATLLSLIAILTIILIIVFILPPAQVVHCTGYIKNWPPQGIQMERSVEDELHASRFILFPIYTSSR